RPAGALDAKTGTIRLWVQPQRELRLSPARLLVTVLAAPGEPRWLARIRVTSAANLTFSLGERGRLVRFDHTHLKRGKWYHFAWTWDAGKGRMDQYLWGQPESYSASGAWEAGQAPRSLRIGSPLLAVDDLRIYRVALGGDAIRRAAGVRATDRMEGEGIMSYEEPLDPASLRGRLLYENTFDADLDDWRLEGPGNVRIENGRLYMESTKPHPPPGENGHIVFWNKMDFPRDFLAEWDFSPASDEGLCIVFFCARGRGGEDLFDPGLSSRDGTFRHYIMGDINAYHISYYRNIGVISGICNMRKEHGFYLVSIGRDLIPPHKGGTHHLCLVKQGRLIRFGIDGKLVIRFEDDGRTYGPVWGSGKIGLRQMAPTKAYYDNFRVWALR
ncbi:MAG: DUF1961 family protein, partial [Armatimonadota bacterium]